VVADVTLFKNGQEVDRLRPRRDFFGPSSSPMTIAGEHSTLENDIYVLLTFWQDDQVTFRVFRNPLIGFVWGGGLLLVLGTIVTVYPDPEPAALARRSAGFLRASALSSGD
jgi:cytochrome c-type biogenesis protein CcmF